MTIVFLVRFVFVMASAFGQTADEIQIAGYSYVSGPQLFEQFKSPGSTLNQLIGHGISGFIEVPLDYDRPIRLMKLYYRLPHPLDPSKPSVLFFEGGPGSRGNPDYEKSLPEFNWIYFDRRGVGFSRPETLNDLKNPANFSSINTARDAKHLLDFLGIKTASVYGGSYGTVPATIFAHMYPSITKAVVLEGVVFDGTPLNYWVKPTFGHLLRGFFKNLPEAMKRKVINLSRSEKLPAQWFSDLATRSLITGNFSINFRQELLKDFSANDDLTLRRINDELESHLTRDSWAWGAYEFYHIACKELSRRQPFSSGLMIFDDRDELVPDPKDDSARCREANGTAGAENTYYSSSYPLETTVTYIQGKEDVRTDARNATLHFRSVAKLHANLILVEHGGHGPATQCLETNSCKKDELTPILSKALLGEQISNGDISKIGHSWRLTRQK